MDAFAEELNRQGFGNKSITLYDIRAELNNQYKDLRAPQMSLLGLDLFKELVMNTDLYMDGKLVHGRIQRIIYKRTTLNEDDKFAKPRSSKDGEGYFCPDCNKNFPDYAYVAFSHMGKLECRGRAIGVIVMLDDGVSGFINRKNISDEKNAVDEVMNSLKPGQTIACRVLTFNSDKCSCELSCKTSDLQQAESGCQDSYFNYDREAKDKQNMIAATEKNTAKTNFTKRVISHQSFHNITYTDAERMLATMGQVCKV